MTKPVAFLGSSLEDLRQFPRHARRGAGYQLDKVQRGEEPDNWKSLSDVRPGVCEIRLNDRSGIYRVIYVARFVEAVYVLHAFQKKTQKATGQDLDLVRRRYDELVRTR